MDRKEAEKALLKYMETEERSWFESLTDPKIEFIQEDDNGFVFSVEGCEIGILKDSGRGIILPG